MVLVLIFEKELFREFNEVLYLLLTVFSSYTLIRYASNSKLLAKLLEKLFKFWLSLYNEKLNKTLKDVLKKLLISLNKISKKLNFFDFIKFCF